MTRRWTSWIRQVRSAGTRISMSPSASAPGDRAAVAARERHDPHAALVRGVNRAHDVLRVARRRDREQHVRRLAERAHLLREDFDERVVVCDRRQRRAVRRQCDGGQPGTLQLEPIEQLAREVLRVGCRAAVAAAQDLAVLEQAARHRRGRGGDRGREPDRGLLRRDAVLEMLAYSLFHRRSTVRRSLVTLPRTGRAVQLASKAFLIH